MKTYHKLLLSLFTLLLAGLVGASQLHAFTPGFQKERQAETPPCKKEPLPSTKTLTVPVWNNGAYNVPSVIDEVWTPGYQVATRVQSKNDANYQDTVPAKGVYINRHNTMKILRSFAGRMAGIRKADSTRRERYRDELKEKRTAVTDSIDSIWRGQYDTTWRNAIKAFNGTNDTAYGTSDTSGLQGQVASANSSAGSAVRSAYNRTWGDTSRVRLSFDGVVEDVKEFNAEIPKLEEKATAIQNENCTEQTEVWNKAAADIAEIEDDRKKKEELETEEKSAGVTSIEDDRNAAVAAGTRKRNTDVQAAKETAANSIIDVIEEKEGEKVEATNSSRDEILANTIAAQDEIATEEEARDELIAAENDTFNEEASSMRVAMDEEITIMREGISSRVDEIRLTFEDNLAAAGDRHRTNMSTIRSRWSGRIAESRNRAEAARKVLNKRPSANWSVATRRQLLQAQRQAAAQLASALKSLRYAKVTRDKQFANERSRYKQQVANIKKREKKQLQITQGPVNQQIANMQRKLQAQILVLQQTRDAKVAEITAKAARKNEQVQRRADEANARIVSDLATRLATLERQKLQASSRIEREMKVEVAQIDDTWTVEKVSLENTAKKEIASLEKALKASIATLNQEARNATKSVVSERDSSIKTLVSTQKTELSGVSTEIKTARETAQAAVKNLSTDILPTARENWEEAKDALVASGQEKVDGYNETYGDKMEAAATKYGAAVSKAMPTATSQRSKNVREMTRMVDKASKAISKMKD